MKRIVVTLFLAAAFFAATPAHAGFLFGASVGSSSLEIEDFDESDTGFTGRVGYRFLDFFGVEASYVDFGAPEGEIGVGSVEAEAEVNGFALFAVGAFPFADRWEVFGKVGYFSWDLEADFSNGREGEDDGSDLSWGVGLGVKIIGPLKIRAEYENYTTDLDDEDGDITYYSVGVDWQF